MDRELLDSDYGSEGISKTKYESPELANIRSVRSFARFGPHNERFISKHISSSTNALSLAICG